MSLSNSLTESIDKVIETFVERVSKQYNLDKEELQSLWGGKTQNTSIKKDITNSNKMEVNQDNLLKYNKQELIALCKNKGKKCSGTKVMLINRLLGKEDEEEKKSPISKKSTSKKQHEKTPVVKKLSANIPNILIRRNQFNNYEHPESGLVFNSKEKIVIGKQNDNGSIDDLTEEDIDKCNAFKFKYKIPINLDHKSTLENVKVDELSEEEEDEEDTELIAEDSEEIELEDEEELDEEELIGDEEIDEEEEEEEYDL
tara:strand:+ start:69 stop:839 length:771 start_codon:yes stop_codon:yes gene_type:complete